MSAQDHEALVEAMARAILFRDGDNTDRLWEMTHPQVQAIYLRCARAALAAMMTWAGVDAKWLHLDADWLDNGSTLPCSARLLRAIAPPAAAEERQG